MKEHNMALEFDSIVKNSTEEIKTDYNRLSKFLNEVIFPDEEMNELKKDEDKLLEKVLLFTFNGRYLEKTNNFTNSAVLMMTYLDRVGKKGKYTIKCGYGFPKSFKLHDKKIEDFKKKQNGKIKHPAFPNTIAVECENKSYAFSLAQCKIVTDMDMIDFEEIKLSEG